MAKHTPERCPAEVRSGDVWSRHNHPCGRKAKANGFCGIHDPEKAKARAAERDARWEKKRADWRIRDAAHELADALEELLDVLDKHATASFGEPEDRARAALKAAGRGE